MIFLTGIVLAIFVFPDGWEITVIIGFGLLEIAETTITWKLSRRWAPKVGPETLIGARGRAITDCRPSGMVRVQGEEWQARCDAGVNAGDPVRVQSRERLVLVVEPTEERWPESPVALPARGMLVDRRETPMASEQNVALVRRYFEECVSGASGPEQHRALAVVDELLSADFAMFYNNQTDTDAARGRQRHKEFLLRHARTFPDDHWTVEAIVADEEVVACQWHFQAQHAETGNLSDVRAADFFRVRNGQLAELRRFLDFESFEQQLRRPAAER